MSQKKGVKSKSNFASPAKDEVELLDSLIDNYGDNNANNDRNVPKDQIRGLTEEVLKEQIVKTIYPQHSRCIQNIVEFSFKDKEYKVNDQINQTVFHFKNNGNLIKIGTQEESNMNTFLEMRAAKDARLKALETVDVQIESPSRDNKKRLLRSQFNYNECSAQTSNPILKNIGISTKPPSVSRFCKSVTQWEIYDKYMSEIQKGNEEEAKGDGEEGTQVEQELAVKSSKKIEKKQVDILRTQALRDALKTLYRVVTLNSDADVFDDFAFYEDEADLYRTSEGVLLPLWRFNNERMKRKSVTAIAWSKTYNDLFACGFGSYAYEPNSKGGGVCVYSLKNTKRPESVINTEYGVCCIDWHPQLPYLLACGLYNGSVAIYDIREEYCKKPLHISTYKENKHSEPIWGIKWSTDDTTGSGGLNFYTVSSDGRVVSWSLNRNVLESEDILELRTTVQGIEFVEKKGVDTATAPNTMITNNILKSDSNKKQSLLTDTASGICLSFHPTNEEIFLIGTEAGAIFKCSLAHKKKCLKTFLSHTLPVYAVSWNTFHPNVFVSASADWCIKLWDDRINVPLRSFDLGRPIGDIVWSSYSSTVFAAVSSSLDSTCFVYDLDMNKYDPVCSQAIVKKTALSHVTFSPTHPVLLVSDQKGGVSCLKLSPNLRKPLVKSETDATKSNELLQIEKLEKFISGIVIDQK